jgi:hypothetical protein
MVSNMSWPSIRVATASVPSASLFVLYGLSDIPRFNQSGTVFGASIQPGVDEERWVLNQLFRGVLYTVPYCRGTGCTGDATLGDRHV